MLPINRPSETDDVQSDAFARAIHCAADSEKVQLVSSDGVVFEIPKSVASQCKMLRERTKRPYWDSPYTASQTPEVNSFS